MCDISDSWSLTFPQFGRENLLFGHFYILYTPSPLLLHFPLIFDISSFCMDYMFFIPCHTSGSMNILRTRGGEWRKGIFLYVTPVHYSSSVRRSGLCLISAISYTSEEVSLALS